jgi:CoA:oxalate CoA-transferase
MTSPATRHRPLAGLRVLDLTQVVSGAVTTMLLADFGAEVIKVEPPDGEPYRSSGYALARGDAATNLNILRFTRGKKSVAIDLSSAGGGAVLRRLIASSDILVENFRPGVLARLGFDREALEAANPDLVYTTVSGFGHDDVYESPYRDRPAYAIVTEAMAGLMHLAGTADGRPVWMGFAMADIFAGTLAFAGTLVALLDRRSGDRGRRVDISMYDGALLMNDLAIAMQSVVGETLGSGQYLLQSPWGPFEASDGHVAVAVLTERQWRSLCEVIGRPELAADPRLRTGRGRSQHHEAIVEPAVGEWCRGRMRHECTERLLAAGVPAAPVNTAQDVLRCPQAQARNMLVEVEAPVVGPVRLVGNPIKLDNRPADGAATRIPQLAEDTEDVLREVAGLSREEIDDLARSGAVRLGDQRRSMSA